MREIQAFGNTMKKRDVRLEEGHPQSDPAERRRTGRRGILANLRRGILF